MTDADVVTLALEASTYRGSVAVLRGATLLAERDVAMRGESEERLMPAVAGALGDAALSVGDVDRVVCGAGPGSFTSLRIAASIAKGIASGRGIPLHGVSSLLLVAAAASPALPAGRYLVVADAMRDERFVLMVEVPDAGGVRAQGNANRVGASDLEHMAGTGMASLIGPGAPADAGRAFAPHARGVAILVRDGLLGEPVELDSWEPDYGRLAEAQVRWEATHGRALGRP